MCVPTLNLGPPPPDLGLEDALLRVLPAKVGVPGTLAPLPLTARVPAFDAEVEQALSLSLSPSFLLFCLSLFSSCSALSRLRVPTFGDINSKYRCQSGPEGSLRAMEGKRWTELWLIRARKASRRCGTHHRCQALTPPDTINSKSGTKSRTVGTAKEPTGSATFRERVALSCNFFCDMSKKVSTS